MKVHEVEKRTLEDMMTGRSLHDLERRVATLPPTDTCMCQKKKL